MRLLFGTTYLLNPRLIRLKLPVFRQELSTTALIRHALIIPILCFLLDSRASQTVAVLGKIFGGLAFHHLGEQRLSEITIKVIKPIKNLQAWARFGGGACAPLIQHRTATAHRTQTTTDSMEEPRSCLHHLLPRDLALLSRLRAPSKFPRNPDRTGNINPSYHIQYTMFSPSIRPAKF